MVTTTKSKIHLSFLGFDEKNEENLCLPSKLCTLFCGFCNYPKMDGKGIEMSLQSFFFAFSTQTEGTVKLGFSG